MATRPKSIRVFAPAKINLFLHVTGKRSDGFHDLQSLVAFAGVGDTVVVEVAKGPALTIDGPFAGELASDAPNNLIVKGTNLLAKKFGVPAALRFTLTKNLPVASGIGGGSADAAAAIRGTLALWGMPDGDVMDIAAQVGSDVPVCVHSRTAWMEGRGEHVTLLPDLPPVPLVLVNPGVGVSTADVFRKLLIGEAKKLIPPVRPFRSAAMLISYLRATRNDLEPPAVNLQPAIGNALRSLMAQGAIFTRMSGSGATCFGLFETGAKADQAAREIASKNAGWWVRATRFASIEGGNGQ